MVKWNLLTMKIKIKKRTLIWSILGVLILIIVITAIARNRGGNYHFVTVARGSITEEVDVTGNTTPVQSLDLAFQAGGTIAAVYKNSGNSVNAGDAIARLDTSDLQAQLAQAQASVDAAQATLDKLQAGPTPQSVQISQTALASAEQSLANAYANVGDTLTAALAKANDAVRNQISPLFSDAESNSPHLTFTTNDSQIVTNAEFERLQASQELNTWQTELTALLPVISTSSLTQALARGSAHLAIVNNLLTTVATSLINTNSLSASTLATYKTDVANAVTEINSAASSITSNSQTIASQETAVAQAQAQLNATLAGSTTQDIAAQQAVVEQAKASAQSIQVKINQATLTSPITGIITVQNAKIGQITAAGQTIASVISASDMEVDAYIPETDIGKIAIGNAVDMTFDAFSGETFTGKIFFIDPAETIVSGVVEYKVKTAFDTADPRMKSGLTANLTIKAKTNDHTLIIPQYAVIQNASGTFVEILQNNQPTQIPVTLGIRDQEGNVEVLSGITEGQSVINVGLKAQ
jgi:HlyD family secretion protein